MKCHVRNVQLDDANEVINILNPIIESGAFTVLDKPFTVEAERAFISNFPAKGTFHVAEDTDNHSLVGFQTVEPFAAYSSFFDHVGIIGTFVHIDHQRQGVASSLFQATFQEMRQKGYEKIFAYVRSDNPTALSTYQRQGFSVIGTAKKQAKIKGTYIDEIMIERFL